MTTLTPTRPEEVRINISDTKGKRHSLLHIDRQPLKEYFPELKSSAPLPNEDVVINGVPVDVSLPVEPYADISISTFLELG